MKLAEAGHFVEMGFAAAPDLLEVRFATERDSKSIHGNEHGALLLIQSRKCSQLANSIETFFVLYGYHPDPTLELDSYPASGAREASGEWLTAVGARRQNVTIVASTGV
jgi:hypothetical protein